MIRIWFVLSVNFSLCAQVLSVDVKKILPEPVKPCGIKSLLRIWTYIWDPVLLLPWISNPESNPYFWEICKHFCSVSDPDSRVRIRIQAVAEFGFNADLDLDYIFFMTKNNFLITNVIFVFLTPFTGSSGFRRGRQPNRKLFKKWNLSIFPFFGVKFLACLDPDSQSGSKTMIFELKVVKYLNSLSIDSNNFLCMFRN